MMPDEPEFYVTPEPETAPDSQRARIRGRLASQREKVTFDLAVPGAEPPLYCRFEVQPYKRLSEAANAIKDAEKERDDEKVMRVNCQLVADACLGVFELDEQGKPISCDPAMPDGPWPRFGPKLAEALGIDNPPIRTVDLVPDVITEAGVFHFAGEIMIRSGFDPEAKPTELKKSSRRTG